MKLQRILIENFRNHSSSLINCSPGVNLFVGDNGEGKTNVLEAISYLCLTKSFYAASDAVVLKIGENSFVVSGSIVTEHGVDYDVRVDFNKALNQKTVSVNKAKVDKASSLIGMFPVVLLSPEQSAVTFGSPADRRRFVDFVISQSSRAYLEDLIDYRRILKHRNSILADIQSTRGNYTDVIQPWNESLVKSGTAVMKKRMEFIRDYQSIMIDSYNRLSGSAESPGVTYVASFECNEDGEKTIADIFTNKLNERLLDEQRIGYSLVGPHRDEFNFQINNINARNYASQGQHKTLLIALKLAEFFYLKERCNETPILLLDDVLSELDERRSRRLLEITANLGQIFITSTDERALRGLPAGVVKTRRFFVKQGSINDGEKAGSVN